MTRVHYGVTIWREPHAKSAKGAKSAAKICYIVSGISILCVRGVLCVRPTALELHHPGPKLPSVGAKIPLSLQRDSVSAATRGE
jgi:hypothetical protein